MHTGVTGQAPIQVFPDGGYALLPHSGGKALLRCPRRFRHRPAHCDLLHVDLWHNGINLLRDGGTFSYHGDDAWQQYFSGTAAHCTAQFDDHDQMPRISRFLFGKWPTMDVDTVSEDSPCEIAASYSDWKGCQHRRQLRQLTDGIEITDTLQGFDQSARIRWRLAPELSWSLDGTECSSEICALSITPDEGVAFEPELTEGWESLYYLERTPIPVLQLTISEPAQVTTTVRWATESD